MAPDEPLDGEGGPAQTIDSAADDGLGEEPITPETVSVDLMEGNSVVGGRIIVHGDLVVGANGRPASVPMVDVTDSVAGLAKTFAAPPNFPEIVHALAHRRCLVLTGQGTGKRIAALQALRALDLSPLLTLPSDIDVSDFIQTVEDLGKTTDCVGVLVESVDLEKLNRLGGFAHDRLKASLKTGGLILTTNLSFTGYGGLAAVECRPPATAALTDALAARYELPPEMRKLAHAVVAILSSNLAANARGASLSPAVVSAAIELLRGGASDPDDIAARVAWQPDKLDEWLNSYPTADALSRMAGGTTLAHVPADEAEPEIGKLAEALSGELEVRNEGTAKTFASRQEAWPGGFIGTRPEVTTSHFGSHNLDVLFVCPPNDRTHLLWHLWHSLGSDFRQPYLRWLSSLASHPTVAVRSAAAATAGTLFVRDPVTIEKNLLRLWAKSDSASVRRTCAAALGVPVSLDVGVAGARALASQWATTADAGLRHTAVLAYGGALGAWDSGSAAAYHLWQIGETDPLLRRSCDVALANLTCAGAGAARARGIAIEVVASQCHQRPHRQRAFGVAALIVRSLSARHRVAHESLLTLLSDYEREALEALGRTLALALLTPSGFNHAKAAIGSLLGAIAAAQVQPEEAFSLIRAMQMAARDRDEQERFGNALYRVIKSHQRHQKSLYDAGELAIARFYERG